MFSTLRHHIQNAFIAGVVIVVPIGITILLLGMMFRWLDSLFAPLALRLTERSIPGLGIGSTLLIIFVVGLLVTNMVGRALISFGETLVDRIPFIRKVYAGAKQFLETVTLEQQRSFTQVVLIEYPKKGSYAVGFVTGEVTREIQTKFSEPFVNVFVARSPSPTGFLLLVPKKDAIALPINIEEGMKIVVSGGLVYPQDRA